MNRHGNALWKHTHRAGNVMVILSNSIKTSLAILLMILSILFFSFKSRLNILILNLTKSLKVINSLHCVDCYYIIILLFQCIRECDIRTRSAWSTHWKSSKWSQVGRSFYYILLYSILLYYVPFVTATVLCMCVCTCVYVYVFKDRHK